jgi:TatD DNase family protein
MPAAGLAALAVTVEPAEYERLAACLEALPAGEANALVAGLGLHPWYVSEAGLAQFLQWAPQARLLGEVGLDAAPAHLATFALQRRAFACVAHEAARENHVLSIHAVRAASEVLELLQEARAFDTSTCIFHWFSGSSAELTRCREAGAWFSVSHRMLASKRGRAYAQALPKERLLLETDLPAAPGEALTPAQLVEDLAVTLAQLAEVRKVSSEELKAQLAANAAALRALV